MVMVHAFNPRRQRQEDLWVWGQPGLQNEFQDRQGYAEKPYLKKPKSKQKKKISLKYHQGDKHNVHKKMPWTVTKLYISNVELWNWTHMYCGNLESFESMQNGVNWQNIL